jgi:hypothetical protein
LKLSTSGKSKKDQFGLIARILFISAAVLFGAWSLRSDWPEFLSAVASVPIWKWLLSILLVFVGLLTTGLVWLKLLSQLGHRPSLRAGLYVFFVGQLGKYIPGSVWSLGVQAEMARRLSIPPRTTVANGLVFLYWNVATAVFFGSVAVQFQWVDLEVSPLLAGAIGLLSLLGITPPATNLVTKLLAGQSREQKSKIPDTALLFALLSVVWFVYGLAVFILVPEALQPTFHFLWAAIGAFSLAYAAGVAIIFAPAGLGVREGVIVVLISPFLGIPNAIAVAVLTRVIHTLADFTIAGIAWIWYRKSKVVTS